MHISDHYYHYYIHQVKSVFTESRAVSFRSLDVMQCAACHIWRLEWQNFKPLLWLDHKSTARFCFQVAHMVESFMGAPWQWISKNFNTDYPWPHGHAYPTTLPTVSNVLSSQSLQRGPMQLSLLPTPTSGARALGDSSTLHDKPPNVNSNDTFQCCLQGFGLILHIWHHLTISYQGFRLGCGMITDWHLDHDQISWYSIAARLLSYIILHGMHHQMILLLLFLNNWPQRFVFTSLGIDAFSRPLPVHVMETPFWASFTWWGSPRWITKHAFSWPIMHKISATKGFELVPLSQAHHDLDVNHGHTILI